MLCLPRAESSIETSSVGIRSALLAGAGGMDGLAVKALTAPAEDPGSGSCTHMVTHSCL